MGKRSRAEAEFLRRKAWFRFFRTLTILILLASALFGGFMAGLFVAVAQVLPRGEALSDIRPTTPTRVLASDGTLLGRIYLPDQNREIVPLSRMGQIVNATIAIEDVRFYTHPGIDPRGIMRAMVKNLTAGDIKEGASTITQQLARNLYLHRRQQITRKLQEMVLALELERRYSKDEILETYLNQVFYGSNTHSVQSWGAQMAAHNYFGKDIEQLTLPEAALLAGLPKNPKGYSPYVYPERAKQRRDLVLAIMRENALISDAQYQAAKATPIKLVKEKLLTETADYHAPYFVRHIISEEMKRIFGEDAKDYITKYGVDIYTSLDPRMQKVAEEAVSNQVKRNKYRRIDDGALISIDPQTGFIKAMVGGTDFKKNQFNVITQGFRQPGSSFKPFDYTTALLHGYTADTIIYDRPHSYPLSAGRFWTPNNSDGSFLGAIPLKKALWLSRNCAAASVAADIGIKEIIKVAYRMGIKHPLDENLSTALGASVVMPLEICSAYGTLANHGVHNPPTGIMRVVAADGSVLYEYSPQPRRALPIKIADSMKEIMRGAIEYGTGRPARCPFPASGKTGTTNSYRDAWFIGYTDDLVTAVWVGNRDYKPMRRTFGGTVPAPIWRQFMMVAHPIMAAEHRENGDRLAMINGIPDDTTGDTSLSPAMLKKRGERSDEPLIEETETQASVTSGDTYRVAICAETGDRATQWCPEKVLVTYVKGGDQEPPSATCSVHTGPDAVPNADDGTGNGQAGTNAGVLISVCAETGKIATDKCPTVLLRRFKNNAPTETCPLHGEE